MSKELTVEELLVELKMMWRSFGMPWAYEAKQQRKPRVTQAYNQLVKLIEDSDKGVVQTGNKGDPGGLAPGEYMHEWIEKDAVELDLPTEEIIGNLCRDNKLLHDKLLQTRQPQKTVTREWVEMWVQELSQDTSHLHHTVREAYLESFRELYYKMLKELGMEVVE